MNNIPSVFWYSLSLAILILTVSFVYISYSASSVSVEIASTKIKLISAIESTKKINNSLKETIQQSNCVAPSEESQLESFKPLQDEDKVSKIEKIESALAKLQNELLEKRLP